MMMRSILLLAMVAALLVRSSAGAVSQTDVFVAGRDGYHTYRIPAVLRDREGVLLAFCEGRKNSGADTGDIDLLVKRSTNGGRTWGPQHVVWDDGANTCGNPCPVVDAQTGEILLLASHNPGADHEAELTARKTAGGRTVWLLRSADHGKTWSAPRDLTAAVKKPEWGWYATGPGIGIQIQHGPHAGRIVVPCDHSYRSAPAPAPLVRESHTIYSDDHGRSWQIGASVGPDTNECQVAELFDDHGTLLIDMRSYAGRHCRAQSTSSDGGVSWKSPWDVPVLVEPVCQAALLRWEVAGPDWPGWLLFSNPADPTKRVALTVRATPDNGKTWPLAHVLHAGPAAYSSLVALDAGCAGCLYENGEKRAYERITFARFQRSDLVAPTHNN